MTNLTRRKIQSTLSIPIGAINLKNLFGCLIKRDRSNKQISSGKKMRFIIWHTLTLIITYKVARKGSRLTEGLWGGRKPPSLCIRGMQRDFDSDICPRYQVKWRSQIDICVYISSILHPWYRVHLLMGLSMHIWWSFVFEIKYWYLRWLKSSLIYQKQCQSVFSQEALNCNLECK